MMAWKDQKCKLHFGFLDTKSCRSQESRLFITGIPKLWNAKRRNPEIGTSTKTPFRRTGSWRCQGNSRHEIMKCETTPFQSFRYRELEDSRVETLHHRSHEVVKCEMPKSRNRHINKDSSFGYRELEVYQKLNSVLDTKSWKC
jgi:hypothetical protein